MAYSDLFWPFWSEEPVVKISAKTELRTKSYGCFTESMTSRRAKRANGVGLWKARGMVAADYGNQYGGCVVIREGVGDGETGPKQRNPSTV